jgi:glycosidase
MDIRAILHRGRPLDCFPTSEHSMYIRLRTARGDLDEVSLVYAENKFNWTTEPRVERRMELLRSDELYDYYGAELELGDTRLAYVFRLVSGGELRYLCEEGVVAEYDWDFGYFNYFQYPYVHGSDVMRVPDWVRGAVCYQIFPDRFRIGSGKEDTGYINLEWGERPTPKSFAGGDLRGIEEGLPYLEELGVNCIYMTPVFKSVSNHKYDIEDYFKVDEHFGGDEALRSLIKAAHARGMKVVLDGVFNHCAYTNPIFADTAVRGRESPYWDWFYIEGERSSFTERNYRTFADVPYMPKLNTDNDGVIDYFCRVGRYWIEEFGADGWRLDVSDEISMRFLRRFREAVKAADPDAIIIGEVWHGAQEFLRGDMYDGVMNYGLTKACLDLLAFGRIDAAGFASRLCLLLWRNINPACEMMFNLLDSHDTDRFLSQAGGDRKREAMALAVMFFFPGMPMVFYGDEIGTEGGYDPDCRRCFRWERETWDMELYTLVKKLAALRRDERLSRGGCRVSEQGGVVEIERFTRDRSIALYINPSDTARSLPDGTAINAMDIVIKEKEM